MPIDKLVRAGKNTLNVTFNSVYDSCQYTKDLPRANVSCPGRVYVRQAASSWGWDWVNRYSPQGIWRPIYLVFVPKTGAGAAITALTAIVRPQPTLDNNNSTNAFSVEVRVTIHATAAVRAVVHVSGNWATGTSASSISTALVPGDNFVRLTTLTAENVELWWPSGYGPQALYNLTAQIAGSTMTRRFGFRSVRLTLNPKPQTPYPKT